MRVMVIGGGVAGSAAALALRRIGADVTVYEAYADPAGNVGSFVSLASNGLRGLDALGCLGEIQRAGVDVPRQRMWSASGRLLGDVPRGRRGADPLHSVTLMRDRLVAALRAAATSASATIVTGERLARVVTGQHRERATDERLARVVTDQHPRRVTGERPVPVTETGVTETAVTEAAVGVVAEFDSGHRDTADLLVAADGIWSTVRGQLDPAAPHPEYAGLYTISGVSRDAAAEPGVFHMTFARNGAFIHVPAGDGEVWWSAQIADPVEPDRAGVTDAEWLRRTAELYRREAVPSAIIAATTELHTPVIMHALDPVPTWHNGRIVLVGDAAHPVGAGQGASTAIEDALVLARSLAGGASVAGIPAALAAYDAERRPRVVKLLGMAEDNRGAKKAGPVKRTLQAAAMRMFVPLFYERATSWLYAYDPPKIKASLK